MVNITCFCFIRFVSAVVLATLVLSNLYFLYEGIFLMHGVGMTALHLVFYLFGMVAVPIVASVPLLYDVFRSQNVKYYVFVGSAFIALLGFSALFLSVAELGVSEADRYDIFRFAESLIVVLIALLLVLVSTVWRKYIRLFYGVITSLFLVYYILFALVFYLIDFFDPVYFRVPIFFFAGSKVLFEHERNAHHAKRAITNETFRTYTKSKGGTSKYTGSKKSIR